jgi:protein involved in polysaccharide export with SLBB domain
VAGRTPEEADLELTRRFAEKVNDPQVTVILRSPQRVYVGGEVVLPGIVEIRNGGLTVLQAVIEAGGWNREHAEPRSVLVVRNVNGRLAATTVDLKKVMETGVGSAVYLAANDVVYVPQSKISKANQWVEQNINRIFPFTPFTVTEQRGASTVGLGL